MFGNRSVPPGLTDKIGDAVIRAIGKGMNEFIVGGRGGFDSAAVRALIQAKKRFPDIRLGMLLAYHPVGKIDIPDGFDGTIYPPGMEKVPMRFAIVRANMWAVENADRVIAYAGYAAGNSGKLLAYARKKGVCVDEIK